MNKLSTKSWYGLGLFLSIIILIACAIACGISGGPSNGTTGDGGRAITTLLAFVAMACMCFYAERFDGGIPRFYEDLHRADRHS